MVDRNSTFDGTDAAGVWTTSAGQQLDTNNTTYAGVCVDFGLPTAANGIILDPPIFKEMDIVFTAQSNIVATFTYDMWLVDSPSPELFSATYLPSTLIADGNVIQMVTFGTHAGGMAAGEELVMPVDLLQFTPVYRRSTWNGIISVIFQARYAVAPATLIHWTSYLHATPTRYATDEVGFISGMVGFNPRAKSRVGRCDRCGEFMLRERMMRDGWAPGLWVCADCWDEEDPPEAPIPPDAPPIND